MEEVLHEMNVIQYKTYDELKFSKNLIHKLSLAIHNLKQTHFHSFTIL